MKKFLIGLTLLSSVCSASENVFSVTMNLSGIDTYAIKGNTLEGLSSQVKGNLTMQGIMDDQNINMSVAVPPSPVPNTTTVIIQNKKQIRLIEPTNGVDTVIKAKVKKSFRGKLKSIKISDEEYLSIMRPALEKQGLDGLENLNIEVDGTRLETSIEVSDYECSRVDDQLECESSAKVVMSISQ